MPDGLPVVITAVPCVPDSSYTYTAHFVPDVPKTLTVTKLGEGTVSPETGNHDYAEGDYAFLTATPAETYEFGRWEWTEANGTPEMSTNSHLLHKISGNATARAVFTKPTNLLLHYEARGL